MIYFVFGSSIITLVCTHVLKPMCIILFISLCPPFVYHTLSHCLTDTLSLARLRDLPYTPSTFTFTLKFISSSSISPIWQCLYTLSYFTWFYHSITKFIHLPCFAWLAACILRLKCNELNEYWINQGENGQQTKNRHDVCRKFSVRSFYSLIYLNVCVCVCEARQVSEIPDKSYGRPWLLLAIVMAVKSHNFAI